MNSQVVVTSIEHIYDNLFLFGTSEGSGIIATLYTEKENLVLPQSIIFQSKLDTFSGKVEVRAFTTLDAFKTFSMLDDSTKKISAKILIELSEMNYVDQSLVLAGKKKIKGLSATGLEQLNKITELIKTPLHEIEIYVNYLLDISSNKDEITKWVSKNYEKIKGLDKEGTITEYLSPLSE